MDFYSLTHFSGELTQMANIEINELKPAGAELFSDFEGFMNELSDSELDNINGGDLQRTRTYAWTCGGSETDTYAFSCAGLQLEADNAYVSGGQLQLEALP